MSERAVRDELEQLLRGGQAHARFEAALKAVPVAARGRRPRGVAHNLWELLEHMRIAQWDILEFSRDPRHVSPPFPAGYWPLHPTPPNAGAWTRSVNAFRADLESMIALVQAPTSDLYTPFAHGDGQNLLREAMLVADHNAYHLGQIISVRQLLGNWHA